MARAELAIGGNERERLVVRIVDARHDATASAPYDRWLDAQVSIRAGGFAGEFDCVLQPGDFERFASDLVRASGDLRTVVEFVTLERQLAVRLTGDGLGHFRVDGEAIDRCGDGNRLTWELEAIDQTNLPAMIASAKAIARM
jgi:hypothetical protein